MYQMYLQFLKDVENELSKTLDSSNDLMKEYFLSRALKTEDKQFFVKKFEEFKFSVDKYHLQASEKFRENLKANIEGPVQTQTHFASMKNQRQKSKSFQTDDVEKIIDYKIQDSFDRQKLKILEYMDTFEEEFNYQNNVYFEKYQKIEQQLSELQL